MRARIPEAAMMSGLNDRLEEQEGPIRVFETSKLEDSIEDLIEEKISI